MQSLLRHRHFCIYFRYFPTLGVYFLLSFTSLQPCMDAFALRQPCIVVCHYSRFCDRLLTLRSYLRSFMIFRSLFAAISLMTFQSPLMTHCVEPVKFERSVTILQACRVAWHGVLFGIIDLLYFHCNIPHCNNLFHNIAVTRRFFD